MVFSRRSFQSIFYVLILCLIISCRNSKTLEYSGSSDYSQSDYRPPFDADDYTEAASNIDYEMVAVEGGAFMMGSDAEDADMDEKPSHKIRINSFYIGRFEVTQRQWQIIMGENPAYNKCSECPVEDIESYVEDFIEALNSLTGKNYRLPTEAEWEYAARGGRKSKGYKYSGSNNIDDVGWCSGNSRGVTHPVGYLEPNELGIYDMSGNVWEPCSDKYYADYYNFSIPNNPKNSGLGDYQVLRGGSWINDEWNCRSSNRIEGYRKYGSNTRGLRLAHSIE